MASATKTAPKKRGTKQPTKTKRAPAKQSKRSPAKKQNGKPKTTAKRAPAKQSAKRTVRRSTLAVSDRDKKSAPRATALMRENTRGDKRGPVNATQVALVRSHVGRKSIATVAKTVGFKSAAQMKSHARGSLETMPDGASAKLTEFARSLGDGPGASKIRGRKLTAILVSL